jgi:hypothetical protein
MGFIYLAFEAVRLRVVWVLSCCLVKYCVSEQPMTLGSENEIQTLWGNSYRYVPPEELR